MFEAPTEHRWMMSVCLLVSCLCLMQVAQDDFPEIRNNERDQTAQPMSAAEAAAKMRTPDGFRVSVFASEPDVQNPIGMAWDDKGRMWVAENFTYSDRTQRFDLSHRDRVLIFEDSDHDGMADSRRVFTDNVQMLTSVEVGRGGVWLMCPPQLLFIPDADEDGVADGPAQVVLDGFTVAQDNYHNFANGLSWGPDGWLYGRCGHSCPGRLGVPGTAGENRVPIDGGIWRFHPERKVVEVLCHGTVNPWGHDWDKNGELFFINTVIGHLWHCMPGAHFRESFGESRNPNVYERLDMIADHYHFDTTGKWSAGRGGKANNFGGGHAHIGMMIYQGDRWPARYRNKLFTLNMHGRRANVEKLERSGAGYVGHHEPDVFLAEDPFFRGIELSTGPDGNVFVLDWSDTGECHDHTGVHRTSGRIYKISHGESREPETVPKPYCLGGTSRLPQLWRQYQAGETTPAMLRSLLRDPDPHVRVWAIRLLTDFWPLDTVVGPQTDITRPDDPETRAEFVRMAREDESGLVHLTLASTLQRLAVEHRAELATELVKHKQHASDRDLPLMVWFGLMPVADRDPESVVAVATACEWPVELRWIARKLATRIEDEPHTLNGLLASVTGRSERFQMEALRGLHDAFRGWRKAPKPVAWDVFATTEGAKKLPNVVLELNTLFGDGRAMADIRRLALDKNAMIENRRAALKTLIDARPKDLRKVCDSLIGDRAVNGVAVSGLALFDDPAIGTRLARNYRRFHPDDRPAVLATLVSRRSFAGALLDNLGDKKGQLSPAVISASHARQIRSLGAASLDEKLADVWGDIRDSPAERRALIEQYRSQLDASSLAGANLENGRALFRKTCSQCHVLYGDGKKIGPDLTGAQRSSLDYLLENVLDPGAVVGRDYRMTVVQTADGRSLSGLVVSKDNRTLKLQTETELLTLHLLDIDEMKETRLSPMPDGLLKNLAKDDVRDLFAYLMHPTQVALPKKTVR